MSEQAEYIKSLFRNCRRPVQQIAVIADLTGLTRKEVLNVLRKEGKIPAGVTEKNYRADLKRLPHPPITEEMRRYIIGSVKLPQTLAKELHIPLAKINAIRREARREAMENGKRAAEKPAKKRTGHAKNAAGDGKRAGAGDRRGGTRKEREPAGG